MTYDAMRRLLSWQNAASSPTSTASYAYDGEGNRVWQQTTSSGTTTTTTYVGTYEEIATTGSTTNTIQYYQAGGVAAISVNGTLSYLVSDTLGSVSEALSSTGSMQAAQLYLPYGGGRYSSGTMPTTYGFTDQHLDPSGLMYFHARYYDPALGLFINADVVQGLNRYGYVGGNPETRTDPTGKIFCDCTDGGGDDSSDSGRGSGGGIGGGGGGADAVALLESNYELPGFILNGEGPYGDVSLVYPDGSVEYYPTVNDALNAEITYSKGGEATDSNLHLALLQNQDITNYVKAKYPWANANNTLTSIPNDDSLTLYRLGDPNSPKPYLQSKDDPENLGPGGIFTDKNGQQIVGISTTRNRNAFPLKKYPDENIWILPPGTNLAAVGLIAVNDHKEHYAIVPIVPMTTAQYNNALASLPWTNYASGDPWMP